MAIKTNKKVAIVHVDPLSLSAEIEVLSGNAVQVFNRDTQEYMPDRTLVPVIMLPSINVIDPHNIQNGKQELTGVEWYHGSPKGDGSNRITDSVDFEIGTGEVEGFPKYSLKVKKNVDPNSPEEIFAIAIFTDKRRNIEVRVERSKKIYTAYYDAQNYSVKLDTPPSWTINPLSVKPDSEGYWKHTINAQLYSGKQPVVDGNAAYWWEIYENGVWRTVTDDDTAIWIDCKDEAGNFTRSLTFDARLMPRTTAFRARAAYYEGVRPESPLSDELQVISSVKMEMPKSLSIDTIQTKGSRMKMDMSNPVGYEVIISYNKGIVDESKDHLFNIEWYAQSDEPGSREVLIGKGRRVEFIPKDKGFNPKYSVVTYANVKLYSGHAIVVTDKKENAEQSMLTIKGVPVIQPIYK